MPTLAELNAQQAALTKAIAQHELPLQEEAATLLEELLQSETVTTLLAMADELPDGGIKSAVTNVNASIAAALTLINLNLPNLRTLAAE